jgi:DNA invertase Pin-like site-specific DNA recombinase
MTPQIQTPVPHEQRGRKPGPKPGHNSEVRANHRSEIARLLRMGKKWTEIVAIVGCGNDTIAAVAKAIAVPDRARVAHNKLPLLKERAVKDLLTKGELKKREIAERLGIAKNVVTRIANEMEGRTKAILAITTYCTGDANCQCVKHQADRELERKLAARRNELQRNQGGER